MIDTILEMNALERNAVLAGLRLLQDGTERGSLSDGIADIAADGGKSLDADGIEQLIERINLGEASARAAWQAERTLRAAREQAAERRCVEFCTDLRVEAKGDWKQASVGHGLQRTLTLRAPGAKHSHQVVYRVNFAAADSTVIVSHVISR